MEQFYYPVGWRDVNGNGHTQTADDINKDKSKADWLVYDEMNPVYRPYIDLAGRRYRVTDSTIFDVMVAIKGMF
jgi:hypothetical protein